MRMRKVNARFLVLLENEAFARLLVLVLAILLWLPRLSGPIDLRWDGGVYYILGTSLAEGRGYRLLSEPGAISAVQYPPLLPLLIAVHQQVLGTSDPLVVGSWLRLSFFLIFAAYLLAVHQLMRRHLPTPSAAAATLICSLNLYTFFLSDLCFPETLFGLVTVLFFLHQQSKAAPVLAVAAYALRTAGIALLAAWVGESLLRRDLKTTLVRASVALIPVFCWQAYIRSVEARPSYQNPAYAYQRADYQFYNVSYARNMALKDPFAPNQGALSAGALAARIAQNLVEMPTSLGEAVSVKRDYFQLRHPPFNRWPLFTHALPLLGMVSLTVLGGLVLGGIVLGLLRLDRMLALFLVISLLVIGTTPWPQQFTRYLAPLCPFLVLSLFGFVAYVEKRLQGRPARALGPAVVGLVLAAEGIVLLQVFAQEHKAVAYDAGPGGQKLAYRLFFYTDTYRALDMGLDWLGARAKRGDIVAASGPHWVYLRTGLKAVMPPFELDPDKAQRLLDTVPVTYLILDQGVLNTQQYTRPVVERFPTRWKRVFAVPAGDFAIYQRVTPYPSGTVLHE